MNKKALAVLEYDKIISMLRECAGSEMAKTRIGMFRPSSDPYKIQERLAETTEAVTVITAKGALPIGQLYDIENALHLARKGGSLTMKQLLQVLYNMKVTGEIVSFLRSDLPELPILDGMREVLVPFPRLADRIDRCILSEDEMADSASALEKDAANLEQQRGLLTAARAEFSEADTRRTGAQKRLQEITESIDQSRTRLDEFSDKHHRSELQLARVESEFKQIQDRIWEDYELTYATAQPLRTPDFKLGESEKRIAEIRQRIRAMGTVNVAAVDEYRRTVERVEEMTSQRDDLIKARCDLEGIIEELEQKMQKQFTEQFALINANFARTFVRLFGGGTAELRLADPKDALNCGIDIVAQPPGKKLQMLSLLSGGERALTAIAILFAILDLKPTPFCVLDEIEAALDDANIDTYADYLKSYSENTQFIVITHRKGTMERCDALYGVVMEEKGVSKTVSVKLNEALQGA